jgi:hypothetical protein
LSAEKELEMSRSNKIVSITILVLFILACNFVTEPIRDVQNVAATAQSFASSLPVETLQALASQVPVETIQALASQVSPETAQALQTSVSSFGDLFNPQGTPVEVWRDIPIMTQATAGAEFDANNYSFKADATIQEVQDYYKAQLKELGWSETFSMPGDANGAIMVFSKDSSVLTMTLASIEGSTVVILTLA